MKECRVIVIVILYGFLNSASGELAVDFSYCDLMPFSEERAIGVKCTDGVMRSVIIDYEGNEMFLSEGLSFAYVDGFHNGLCVVMDDSQLFGYVDIEGNLIIPCQYTNATSFDNQLAQVQYDGVWYNITSEGIISP